MKRVFSRKLSRPQDCRKYLLELLICTSQVYLDYLLITSEMPKLKKKSAKAPGSELLKVDTVREFLLRRRLRKRLKSLPCWSRFQPEGPFSALTGLHNLQMYIDAFSLHLPEIHKETFCVQGYAKAFQKNRSSSALAGLIVGLEHLGRNHISFVNVALGWAADESSWR